MRKQLVSCCFEKPWVCLWEGAACLCPGGTKIENHSVWRWSRYRMDSSPKVRSLHLPTSVTWAFSWLCSLTHRYLRENLLCAGPVEDRQTWTPPVRWWSSGRADKTVPPPWCNRNGRAVKRGVKKVRSQRILSWQTEKSRTGLWPPSASLQAAGGWKHPKPQRQLGCNT